MRQVRYMDGRRPSRERNDNKKKLHEFLLINMVNDGGGGGVVCVEVCCQLAHD